MAPAADGTEGGGGGGGGGLGRSVLGAGTFFHLIPIIAENGGGAVDVALALTLPMVWQASVAPRTPPSVAEQHAFPFLNAAKAHKAAQA
eukprot:SAG11_NODE_2239_length_3648_cov_4.089039_4_plen_89_part_00